MKKILCFTLMLLLVGCSGSTDIKPVLRNIIFTAEMTYYNEFYEMEVDISKTGDAVIEVTYPEELKGLKFVSKNGEFTSEYNGIAFESNNYNAMAAKILYLPFSNKTQGVYEKDNVLYIKGECDGGEYTMQVTEAGLPLKISDSAERFEIIIKNLTIKNEKEP